MSRVKNSILALTIVAAFMAVAPSEANADGPLRQWLRGLRNPNSQRSQSNCGCATQPQGFAQAAAPQAAQQVNAGFNPFNLQPGQCMKTCQQTCARTVVNYVPYTAYRTAYKRVPVTTYRPQTSSDPCTGCTVTCMRPCTTYTYQCQRVPYTTYRPVYRQETYKVPVTTITNDCSTGTCGTCATGTCNPGAVGGLVQQPLVPQQNFAPQSVIQPGIAQPGIAQPGIAQPGIAQPGIAQPGFAQPQANFAPTITNYPTQQTYSNVPAPTTTTHYEEVPNGTLNTGASYGTGIGGSFNQGVPANNPPSLLDGINPTTTQRPFLDRFKQTSSTTQSRNNWSNSPATINIEAKTAMSPIRKQWGYSPVRTASYTKPTTTRAQLAPVRDSRIQSRSSFKPASSSNLNGWKEVN